MTVEQSLNINSTDTAMFRALRRSKRRQLVGMLGMMAPSVITVALLFLLPVALFMFRSIDNSAIHDRMTRTSAALQNWDGQGLPDETAYEAIRSDIAPLTPPEAAVLGRNLNYMVPGMSSLIVKTQRGLQGAPRGSPAREVLSGIDPRWGETGLMLALRRDTGRVTSFHLLTAIDLKVAPDGGITMGKGSEAIFLDLFVRTFGISAVVTVLCLIVGFPVAYVMVNSSPTTANLILMAVLVPFWTSLLVRTTAWVILLQTNGLVNDTLRWLHLIPDPIQLIYNKTGIYIAMVHVLLPYLILPLYSVMRNVQPNLLRAAASLGATPATVFRSVFLPLVAPGIAAGCTLVFILSIGFYITPAMVGGPGDQMIGYFIAYFTRQSVNWSLAAALGSYLLIMIAVLYLIVSRTVGLNRLKVR